MHSVRRQGPRAQVRGLYDGEIKYTDIHLGRVFDALDELGLSDDTIVVFVSDHGEEFFDHGHTEHGSHLFNELVRVPLLIRIPDEDPRRVAQLVRTVDLMPTLLDYADAEPPDLIEGRSLRPLIQGKNLSLAPALFEIQQSLETMMKGIKEGQWKLVHNITKERYELYDLIADPLEKVDVSQEHPEKVADLKIKLNKMVKRAEQHGTRYKESLSDDTTPAEAAKLRGLGYLGD